METERITAILASKAGETSPSLTPEEADVLRRALAEAPYFAAPAALLLRSGAVTDPAEAEALKRRVALASSPDSGLAAKAAYGDEWAGMYPREDAGKTDTIDAIDTFLRTYGSTSPEEERLLERLIFNPTPDYAEMLAREEAGNLPQQPVEDGNPDSQESRINSFILSQHPASPHQEHSLRQTPEAEKKPEPDTAPVAAPEHTDDSLLSESLAKIFIKQGRYERAYEIISNLSLNYPKKSVYFADQLRFLQKLIINQRRKDSKKQ